MTDTTDEALDAEGARRAPYRKRWCCEVCNNPHATVSPNQPPDSPARGVGTAPLYYVWCRACGRATWHELCDVPAAQATAAEVP